MYQYINMLFIAAKTKFNRHVTRNANKHPICTPSKSGSESRSGFGSRSGFEQIPSPSETPGFRQVLAIRIRSTRERRGTGREIKKRRRGGEVGRGDRINGRGTKEGRGEHGGDGEIACSGQGDPLPDPMKTRPRFMQDLFQLCSKQFQDPFKIHGTTAQEAGTLYHMVLGSHFPQQLRRKSQRKRTANMHTELLLHRTQMLP
jgi:hypothetical protein